jgi:hypothetical protein
VYTSNNNFNRNVYSIFGNETWMTFNNISICNWVIHTRKRHFIPLAKIIPFLILLSKNDQKLKLRCKLYRKRFDLNSSKLIMHKNLEEYRATIPWVLLRIYDNDGSSFQSFISSLSLPFIFINHFFQDHRSVCDSLQATRTYRTSISYPAMKGKSNWSTRKYLAVKGKEIIKIFGNTLKQMTRKN